MAARRKSSGTRRGGPKKVGGRRLPARSSSAREAKRDVEFVRLNKFLADQGVASRRASDELIAKGKVTVDGDIVTELGTKIDPRTQVVEVGGVHYSPLQDIEGKGARRYYVLNKPSGVVCTNERRETRPRAVDLITDARKGRIYTVGRLDDDSTGLILLTSDGEFAERIAHPRYGVSKTYLVKLAGRISEEDVQKVREGVYLSEGRTAGARVLVRRRTQVQSTLEVTIREGKNREVRRVFARVGHKVQSLKRTRIGPLTHRGLREGRWRALSREEVESLLAASDPMGPGPTPPGRDAVQEEDPAPSGPRRTARRSSARRRRGSPGGARGTRRGSRGGAGRGRRRS